MNVSEVPTVQTTPSVGTDIQKYMVFSILDSSGNSKRVVVVLPGEIYHSDIIDEFKSEYKDSGIEIEVLGGGFVSFVRSLQNSIDIYGESMEFGQEPDREQTVEMFEEMFPEYGVHSD